jgi:uncharacterized protein YbbC (DUF1343 family)
MHLVRGRRVGLVTNQAGVDHRGRSGVEVLRAAGVELVALFSPEHGFRGTADPGAAVATTTDPATGLPIYSLYGATSQPTDAMLSGVEILLVDLQDAGARYYTYLWTTVGVMRAAERRGIPVLVLDRPNPVGGAVQGGVLDTAFRSPVGLLAIPMRHGMTLGELARLARHDLGLGGQLTVIPAAGWQRVMYFDETGLPWIAPSPNLPRLEAVIHYPGLCLFEGTTLSVGRGTDAPFEQIGAPWLDTAEVLAAFNTMRMPGVAFEAVAFTPRRPGDGKFADTLVAGIRLRVTDRAAYDPTLTAMTLLEVIGRSASHGAHQLFPSARAHFERLLASADLATGSASRSGSVYQTGAWTSLTRGWARTDSLFRLSRRPFLLYPE